MKGQRDNVGLVSAESIRLQGKVPQKVWEKGSSQYFKFLSHFVLSFYNCISVLPPTAAALGLEQTVSPPLQKASAPSR